MAVVNRLEVYLINLDPTIGSEQRKTRPCVIVSSNGMNHRMNTVIAVPMTTKSKDYPTRVPLSFDGKQGDAACEQVRALDKRRLIKKLGALDLATGKKISDILVEMFA